MFGSRVDHFFPFEYPVTVSLGQRVRAGETDSSAAIEQRAPIPAARAKERARMESLFGSGPRAGPQNGKPAASRRVPVPARDDHVDRPAVVGLLLDCLSR